MGQFQLKDEASSVIKRRRNIDQSDCRAGHVTKEVTTKKETPCARECFPSRGSGHSSACGPSGGGSRGLQGSLTEDGAA